MKYADKRGTTLEHWHGPKADEGEADPEPTRHPAPATSEHVGS
jgi:hypothetical protein